MNDPYCVADTSAGIILVEHHLVRWVLLHIMSFHESSMHANPNTDPKTRPEAGPALKWRHTRNTCEETERLGEKKEEEPERQERDMRRDSEEASK
ncbi:hypothetical protein ACE6H2_001455 [Prunus campanulata]